MKYLSKRSTAWAIRWHSRNRLDGEQKALLGRANVAGPDELSGCPLILFANRKDARDYVTERYGYIRKRKDLQNEPHGWHVPVPVKVEVVVRES